MHNATIPNSRVLVRVRHSVDLSMESSGGGLEEAPIVLSLRVDDGYRMVTFGGRLRQRGPELSDVAVLTMEIFGDQQGRHDDASIHRYFDGHWRHFFPKPGSCQAFARQCAALSVINQRILEHLFPASGDSHLLDGFPICRNCRGHRCRTFRDVAAWGYCATRKEYFYGLRGHLVITLAGTAVAGGPGDEGILTFQH